MSDSNDHNLNSRFRLIPFIPLIEEFLGRAADGHHQADLFADDPEWVAQQTKGGELIDAAQESYDKDWQELQRYQIRTRLNTPRPPITYADAGRRVGAVSIVAARPKVGKSTLERDRAVRKAAGLPDLFGQPTTATPVLYLALDPPYADHEEHFRKLLAQLPDEGHDLPLYTFYATDEPVRRCKTTEDLVRWLYDLSDKIRPGLIVGDTLIKMMPELVDLNDYVKLERCFSQYQHLAEITSAHISCTHHTVKHPGKENPFDGILGSTNLWASMDSGTVIYGKEENGLITTRKLVMDGRDDAQRLSWTGYCVDKQTGSVSLGDAVMAGDDEDTELAERIRNILSATPGHGTPMTREQYREAGIPDGGTTDRAFQTLVERGELTKPKRGSYAQPPAF